MNQEIINEFKEEYRTVIEENEQEIKEIEEMVGKETAEKEYGDYYWAIYGARRLLKAVTDYEGGLRTKLTLEFLQTALAQEKIIFSEFIRALRTEYLHMKQVDFANFAGKSQQTISAWERGASTPTLGEHFSLLQKALEYLDKDEQNKEMNDHE